MLPVEFDAWLRSPARRPLVMGILNVTPDSFSDGGRYASADLARAHAETMIAAGADLIDVGGESTRPGARRVDAAEQVRRVAPVLRACRDLPVTFSIDTTRIAVAGAALDAGAHFVNDVSAGRDDPEMATFVARGGCPVVLMHMLGQPADMQASPTYGDVVAEVRQFLAARRAAFVDAGVAADRILVDPGLGFGKTADHSLTLLRQTADLVAGAPPLLIGASRKKFIGRLTGKETPADRVFGTAAAVAWAVTQGAAVVRVHDVAAMSDVVKVAAALRNGPAAVPSGVSPAPAVA